ncbi:rhomboid family intramembrane serine protease [Bacteroidia bacterium]|nr:rhomboid family intramembrane serine protease [Bacteroidia bacterium]
MSEDFRPSGFQFLTPVVKNLLIINIIFFALDYMCTGVFHIDLSEYLGLHYPLAKHFFPTQYITYMFMHANFSHIFFNMFALWMFGNILERTWGSKRFLFFYLFCGIGAGLIQNIVNWIELSNYPVFYYYSALENINTIGASGAIYGLLLAFGMTFPNNYIYLYFLLPIKAKWFVIIYGLLELFSGISGSASNIAHFAHLGGMIFGIILILYWKYKDKNKFNYFS